jgi:aminoglycoside phosphotransferase (APT) family kinase protein
MPYQHIEEPVLHQCIEAHYTGHGNTAIIQPIATGKHNNSYFVDCNGKALVLRIEPPENVGMIWYEVKMMSQEPSIHELLLQRTGIPVPRILVYDNSHQMVDTDYLIMERMPGDPASDASFLKHQTWQNVLFRIGECLREAHAIHGTQYGYDGPHRPMTPQNSWADAFAVMWGKLVTQVRDVGGYSHDECAYMLGLYTKFAAVFDRSVPASLLHMDVWAQNILVTPEGKLGGLIDWDRALYGDPEIEFAVLDYCGISEPAFWEGYGMERDDSEEAEIRRVFYLLYEVQKYIIIRLTRRQNPAQAEAYKSQSLQMARSAFGATL